MGTNFYLAGWQKLADSDDDPAVHVGKRSAAGLYCWDCGVTLCKAGIQGVHSSGQPLLTDTERALLRRRDLDLATRLNIQIDASERGWYAACPQCGQTRATEAISHSSAGRELGFNTDAPAPKRGVASCSSFTWAMPRARLDAHKPRRRAGRQVVVVNEYGDYFTRAEFAAILSECPIQYTDSIGQWFS